MHVFVLLGLIVGLLTLHLYLVLRLGISAPPTPGKRVDPRTCREEYEKELKIDGVPFYPEAFFRDAIAVSAAILAVVAISLFLGPNGPSLPPDPTLLHAEPRPDWYFLPMFSLLALSPEWLEIYLMLGLPVLIFLVLILVPFVSGKGERSPQRRPVAVLSVVLLVVAIAVLTWKGVAAPWSPKMFAWSGTPVPVNIVRGLTPEQLQGAVTFQYKDCRNCHALEGQGGHRGPDLTTVATRLTRDELIRQVSQGGGLMPAYGQELKPLEIEALVDFLGTLRPRGQPAATSPPKRELPP